MEEESIMLQQIIRDLYVDPAILAELNDQQKQTLFCKMREEQVRRWKLWNEKLGEEFSKCSSKKRVDFVRGADGEPWVWVMGEHKDDKTIEEILKEEAIEKARKMAEKEAEELRKQMEAQLYIDLSPKIDDGSKNTSTNSYNDDMDIYCSVDELREKINNKPMKNFVVQSKNKYNVIDTRDVLQEMSLNTQKVAQKIALWEKRVTEEKTCEILERMQKRQEEVAKEAEEAERNQEQLWREQERKAKQAEQQIREIARRAREEHRLTSSFEIDSSYSTVCNASGVPPGRNAVIEWYKNAELPKGSGLDRSNNIESWFHGLITRQEAEKLLLDRSYGSFLVRLSEKIWGYAISYRAQEKCKHYLVNAGGNKYQFLGNNQIEHQTLRDLIEYHKNHPLTGGETLMEACPRNLNQKLDELFE